jgi:hypothetical protein
MGRDGTHGDREKRLARLEAKANERLIRHALGNGGLREFSRDQIQRVLAEVDPDTPNIDHVARNLFGRGFFAIATWWRGLHWTAKQRLIFAASEAKRPLGKHI